MGEKRAVTANCLGTILLLLFVPVIIVIVGIGIIYDSYFTDITKTDYVPSDSAKALMEVELYDQRKERVVHGILYDESQVLYIEDDDFVNQAEIFICENCFNSYMNDEGIINSITSTRLKNVAGNYVEAQERELKLMHAITANIDHDIMEAKLFFLNGKSYAFVQLNVNWFSPGELYEYDDETKVFEMLYQFTSADLLGIAEPKDHTILISE